MYHHQTPMLEIPPLNILVFVFNSPKIASQRNAQNSIPAQ